MEIERYLMQAGDVTMHDRGIVFRRIRGRVIPVSTKKIKASQSQKAVNNYDYSKGAAAGGAAAIGSRFLKNKKVVLALAGITALTVGVRAYNSKTPKQFAENFTTGLVKKAVGFGAGYAAVKGFNKLRGLIK